MKPQIKKPLAKGFVTTTHSTNFKSKIRNVIVHLALLGLIPISLADRLIKVGGFSHE